MIFFPTFRLLSSSSLVLFFRPLSVLCQVLSQPNIHLAHKPSKNLEGNGLEKALKILDLLTPKASNEVPRNHLCLIEGCMLALSETSSIQSHHKGTSKVVCINPTQGTQLVHAKTDARTCNWLSSSPFQGLLHRKDALSLFFEVLNQGIKPNPVTFCNILSACGTEGVLDPGRQLHALSISTGFESHVFVGSSLVTLYSKCGELENAYRVFKEMPEKNVVSWTAIITGFAQRGQAEKCWELLHQMRWSTSKPNDFTFASLVSACTASGSLGQGRRVHSQIIQLGFSAYIHVSNALITMYAKCGSIGEAFYVFEKISLGRDLISWNAMIAGYAQHGLAKQALSLLKEMKKQTIDPDAITFLGVLSSCRHAGLIEQGLCCFNSMLEQGVRPEVDHYACIVDLLGRAGLLDEALEFIENMPMCPNAVIWGSLLSSCRLHGNIWVGVRAAKSRLLLEPECAATHVQLANLYAGAGCWNDAAKARKLMKEKGLKTNQGCSWIEIRNKVYRFRAEDKSDSKANEIFDVVDSLVDQMRSLSYGLNLNLDIYEEQID